MEYGSLPMMTTIFVMLFVPQSSTLNAMPLDSSKICKTKSNRSTIVNTRLRRTSKPILKDLHQSYVTNIMT